MMVLVPQLPQSSQPAICVVPASLYTRRNVSKSEPHESNSTLPPLVRQNEWIPSPALLPYWSLALSVDPLSCTPHKTSSPVVWSARRDGPLPSEAPSLSPSTVVSGATSSDGTADSALAPPLSLTSSCVTRGLPFDVPAARAAISARLRSCIVYASGPFWTCSSCCFRVAVTFASLGGADTSACAMLTPWLSGAIHLPFSLLPQSTDFALLSHAHGTHSGGELSSLYDAASAAYEPVGQWISAKTCGARKRQLKKATRISSLEVHARADCAARRMVCCTGKAVG
eukprot:6173944-Pleurochrysis_carterae.AAC.1